MPLYEYRCEKCGHQFEELVSLKEGSRNRQCPKCSGRSAHKIMSVCAARVDASGASECPTCTTGMCELPD